MKIRPVILCGGSGTRLWKNSKKNQPKQFIDFGGWNLMEQTLKRIKGPLFEYPIISTNIKYIKLIKKHLKKLKFKKYKIVVEPLKKNTAPAILSSTLINDINYNEPLIIFPSDHIISNQKVFNKALKSNVKNLDDKNIFVFGVKPRTNSKDYGYFTSKKVKNLNKVTKFIEKPNIIKAKSLIKRKAYWNSGIFFLKKSSIIKNFAKHQNKTFKNCSNSVIKAKSIKDCIFLDNYYFKKNSSSSFDKAILEKSNNIFALKLNILWSDLGSWREILKIYKLNKFKYYNKKNIFKKPWGKYVNLYKGKNFLIKELTINSNSSISLQKHYHREETWLITEGAAKITINKAKLFKKTNESVFIPKQAVHRIENIYKKPLKIYEAQIGSILRENDIIRYLDNYGRVK